MAEGWRQVWEDILDALRGKPQPEAGIAPPVADQPPEAAAGTETAAITVEPVDSGQAQAQEVAGAVSQVQPEPSEPAVRESPSEDSATLAGDTATEPDLGPAATPAQGEAAVDVSAAPEVSDVELTPRELWLERLRGSIVPVVLLILFGVGLWFSGGSRLWAQWTAPKPPASDVIATFDGGQITIADVEAHLTLLVPEEFQAIARTPETLLGVVQDLVTDELVRRWAAARQPDTDEQFSHTMQHITEGLSLESLDLQRHESDIPVTESEIQEYYNANKAQFGDQSLSEVREQIRQTLVSEREQGYIEDYLQRLRDNASITRSFELLDVRAPSEDDLRRYYDANLDQFKLPRQTVVDELQFPIGGDEAAARQNADDALLKVRSGATFDEVGLVITGTLVSTATLIPEGVRDPAWDTAVFGLTEGELSDVFRAGEGFYIVRLVELQPARTLTLDETRPSVLAAVQQQKSDEWFEANGSKTLFTLKGKQYTLGEFYREYRELPISAQAQYAGPEGMAALAEELIERLLLVEDTYDQLLDVENKPLVDEARLQVLKQMLHQEEVDDKIEVTNEEMQAYYDANIDLMALPPKARIRYIRIGLGASADEAQAAHARAGEAYQKLIPGLLQQGADFATVAQEYSEDPDTAANGGEFPDWIGESDDLLAELELHPFHEAVLMLQPDEISTPFQFGDSLYIVQVIERTEPEQLTFEQAQPYIQEILAQQKHEERLVSLSDDLFRQANLVVYESTLLAYFPAIGYAGCALTSRRNLTMTTAAQGSALDRTADEKELPGTFECMMSLTNRSRIWLVSFVVSAVLYVFLVAASEHATGAATGSALAELDTAYSWSVALLVSLPFAMVAFITGQLLLAHRPELVDRVKTRVHTLAVESWQRPEALSATAVAASVFSGVAHLGLTNSHFAENRAAGVLFGFSGLWQLLIGWVGYPPAARRRLSVQLVFNAGLIVVYIASRLWALPGLTDFPEARDTLGLVTKGCEALLIVCLIRLLGTGGST